MNNRAKILAALALAPLIISAAPAQAAEPAHTVTCDINVIKQAYDRVLYGGRVEVVGASLLTCSPTAPDTSDAVVQLYIWVSATQRWVPYGFGERYTAPTTYKHIYDTAGCTRGWYRVYAWHKGCHGTCGTEDDWSDGSQGVYVNCVD